jgi:hypothetical protein
MLARQIVLQTPPESSVTLSLTLRPIAPLIATRMDLAANVANKRLTARLTSLDATLTKNSG